MRPVERVLIRLDDPPWSAVHRVIAGWIVYWILQHVCGDRAPASIWLAWFLVILLALRIVPAICRRAIPFSGEARAHWFARRQIAKRYDSYQWQKLFWIGLGFGGQIVRSGSVERAPALLTAACLLSGAIGATLWHATQSQADRVETTVSPTKKWGTALGE